MLLNIFPAGCLVLAGGHPHVPEPPRAAGHGDLQRPARHQAPPRPRQPRAQAGQEDARQDEVAVSFTLSTLYLRIYNI